MKAILISALTIVCSAAFADEAPKQTALTDNPTISAPSAPSSFCAQPQMVRWFLNSEIGRQIQQRQQTAIAQAVAEHENAAPQKPSAPQK